MWGRGPADMREALGPEADVAVLRQLTGLVIAGLIVTIGILAFLISASLQAVSTIDASVAAVERDQVIRAIASSPGPVNAIEATAIASQLGLENSRVGSSRSAPADAMQVPIGSDMVLVWQPRQIGSETFRQIAPGRIAGGVIFALVVSMIGWRLYVIGRQLDRRRALAAKFAATDALTGLANRYAFDDGLNRRYRKSTRPFALVAIDLDGFKAINDQHGHAAGDRLLVEVADCLRAATTPDDCVARVGGDEFFVLRPAQGVEAFVDDLCVRFETTGSGIAASFGIARSDDFPNSITALTHAADAALYRAKRAGGKSAELAHPASSRNAA